MYTNKIKNIFLLALIVASTIVGAISFPDTAMAAPPGVYVSPAVKKDATASALRTALALCITSTNGGHMSGDPPYQASAKDIADGKWFASGSQPQNATGYIVDGDNGNVECGNLFADRNVAGALGWDSNIAMACALGMKRINNSNCVSGTGDLTKDPIGTDKNKVYAAIDKKYTNATGGNGYNNTQEYLLAAVTYKEACDAKAIVNVKDANADQKNKGYDKVKVVNSKGEIVEVYYQAGNNSEHWYKNYTDNFHFVKENCDWMKDRMNEFADAYAKFIKAHPPAAGEDTSSDDGEAAADGEKTSCQIDGIGWIVCPVMRFLSRAVDGAYAMVSYFLTVPAVSTATTGNPLYDAWSIMRNIANVAFVIMFLVIIYSQLTSTGITNYGIKKLLPKLIIAAILVNVSYWICAIAVDLSNISGTSLKGMLDGISKSLYVAGGSTAETGAGGGWDVLTVGVIAGGAAVAIYTSLSALLPMLVMAAFAIVMVLLVLTIRQALIVILIVVSPLAFVAFLLPNTQSLFKKWKDLFTTLLLMFPIIALIFGGSALASTVITGVAADNEAQGTWFLSLMAAAVTIIPLFITPFLIKTTSGLAGRWGGMINDPNKGPFDRMRKKAEGYRDYRKDVNAGNRRSRGSGILEGEGGALGDKYSKRRRAAAYVRSVGETGSINTARKRSYAKAAADEGAQEYFAKRALNQEGFAQQMTGNADTARGLKASAQSAVDKIFKQDVANREILLTADVRFKNDPQAALQQALEGGDRVQAAAAASMLTKTGATGFDAIHKTLEEAERDGTANSESMNTMKDFIKENGQTFKAKDPAMLRWATQKAFADDGVTPRNQETLAQASHDASYVQKSDAEVAGFAPGAFKTAAAAGAISREQAKSILGNQNIVKDTSPQNLAALKNIAQGLPATAPPAPTTAPTNAPAPAPAPVAPTAPRHTAAYSDADLQALGPQNINMVINNAGGAQNLSDGDISRLVTATHGLAGADTIHTAMQAEHTRRTTPPAPGPAPPTPPPAGP